MLLSGGPGVKPSAKRLAVFVALVPLIASVGAYAAAPGAYSGLTSQGEGITMSVCADGSSILAWSLGYRCPSAQGSDVNLLTCAKCPITDKSFACSKGTACGNPPRVTLSGNFNSTFTVSGALNVQLLPSQGPCCQLNTTWSACLICPIERPMLMLSRSGANTVISWNEVANLYDVVRGSLDTLRSTSGDYSMAVNGCLAEDRSDPSLSYPDPAAPERAVFFVLRPAGCGRRDGTYNSGDPQQVGSRDAKINSSPAACTGYLPTFCQ